MGYEKNRQDMNQMGLSARAADSPIPYGTLLLRRRRRLT